MLPYRIGFGYDVHRLEDNHPFVLGGITVPHHKGAVGHSDADTLIHAICDALLGAAHLGDIGVLFPDTDPAYKGIDSKILLATTMERVREKGFEVGNIDTTVCLQSPKIKNLIPQMVSTLSKVLCISEEQLSIKATTTEKLGFTGREEGVAAYASVLIFKP